MFVYFLSINIGYYHFNLSSQKKFTILVNFNFSKKLQYLVKHKAAVFRLHPLPSATIQG